MSITNAKPRAWHDGNHFTWRAAAAAGLLGLLVACGGGGSDAGSTGTPGATPIMRAEAQVGDYFIYAMTQTTTVPANVPVSAYNSTSTYASVEADGTNQRVTTYGSYFSSQQNTYNVSGAWVSQDAAIGGPGVICSSAPASQSVPPYPRSVGQTWSSTSVRTCGSLTSTTTQTGEIVAREQIVLPAGTFDSHRAVRTVVSVYATSTLSSQVTCWYSVERGHVLRCETAFTDTPAGATTPTSVASTTQILTGLGGPARAAQGNVLPRFHGSWRVHYSGGASGSCSSLLVTASGAISGNCTPTGGVAFAVNGSVNGSGAVAITLPTGGVLTGTLTTPYSGSGSWTDSGLSGTWTATHN